jgi:hypothetical protein
LAQTNLFLEYIRSPTYIKLITDVGNSTALTAYYNPETAPALIVYNASSSSSNDSYSRVKGVAYILGATAGEKVKIYKKETTTTLEHYSPRENNQHVNTYTTLVFFWTAGAGVKPVSKKGAKWLSRF